MLGLARRLAFDGKTYGIPFQRSTPVLYWNKDAFKEAGLDPETPPASWAEMVEMGKKLTKTDASGNPVLGDICDVLRAEIAKCSFEI